MSLKELQIMSTLSTIINFEEAMLLHNIAKYNESLMADKIQHEVEIEKERKIFITPPPGLPPLHIRRYKDKLNMYPEKRQSKIIINRQLCSTPKWFCVHLRYHLQSCNFFFWWGGVRKPCINIILLFLFILLRDEHANTLEFQDFQL